MVGQLDEQNGGAAQQVGLKEKQKSESSLTNSYQNLLIVVLLNSDGPKEELHWTLIKI